MEVEVGNVYYLDMIRAFTKLLLNSCQILGVSHYWR